MPKKQKTMHNSRYLADFIREDLQSKMVFVGGPRQVGKTTLSFSLLDQPKLEERHPAYYNWDNLEMRSFILKNQITGEGNLIILDEVHKFAGWRGLVKGLYDTRKSQQSFLVTGSARLDYYRKGGDSLQGRYHYYRLHPFTIAEMQGGKAEVEQLLKFGGFPEPLLSNNERTWRRWQRERLARVFSNDLRDLESVKEVSKLELLLEHLRSCIGSPISLNSLKNLMNVSHNSIESWIKIFENLYLCFQIAPYGSPKIRAVKKQKKLYFWDWSTVDDPGTRWENMVACHLLKYCHFIEDTEGFSMELRYIRDTDGREVDFVVLKDGSPKFAVECKSSESKAEKNINYFKERTNIPEFYIVHKGIKDYGIATQTGRHLPLEKLSKVLELP